ncbi:MAG: hypothetical protein E5W53_10705 [Mesorhizobium sp.]|nr:MAG: hypothetical protein E5W53_10705 [Mesorhizobium sp.]TIV10673.1 MAG: hypothetical protein E5W00_06605 [Mesorhizobium sp.]
MQDGATFIGEDHGACERIERLGHSCALDSADVQHVADYHRTAHMRQQQSAKLDFALGDNALPLVSGNGEAGKTGRGVDQEERHDVDQALRLQALLKISGGLQVGLRDMA